MCQISVHRGDFAGARHWAEILRNSALGLVAIEGQTPRAQRELNNSDYNLAFCDYKAGNYEAARSYFLKDRAATEEQLAAKPGDFGLQHLIGKLDNLLGFIAEYQGDYAAALERFASGVPRYEKLARLEPATANWRLRQAQATFPGRQHPDLARPMGRGPPPPSNARGSCSSGLIADNAKDRAWRFELQQLRLQQATMLLARAMSPVMDSKAGARNRPASSRDRSEFGRVATGQMESKDLK